MVHSESRMGCIWSRSLLCVPCGEEKNANMFRPECIHTILQRPLSSSAAGPCRSSLASKPPLSPRLGPPRLSLPLFMSRVRLADNVTISIMPLSGLPPHDLVPAHPPSASRVGRESEEAKKKKKKIRKKETYLAMLASLLDRTVNLHAPRLLNCSLNGQGRLCAGRRRYQPWPREDRVRKGSGLGEGGLCGLRDGCPSRRREAERPEAARET
ncbi:hypothetical protein SODALDRAFT_76976 [Sodiomyces alkalinus F11]|uniref:Uncharacterized protein n=1 Tax=Sodiomyces alkalinus (strain CBS 110278 / VKM F-3762 / F11) TaxID=1314773 RepID=A0A3N2PKJ2_SODAK|nr:hypothetical protein SODALDRAFT_76976 [Sodiomyces alkalinus F11]ROT35041.1 hypothetical protein SODALDRAFT_76976 [Sodiomyces alkalinus F11]